MQKQFKEYLLTKNYRPIYNLAKEKLKPIKVKAKRVPIDSEDSPNLLEYVDEE